jgi:hypothetical protein
MTATPLRHRLQKDTNSLKVLLIQQQNLAAIQFTAAATGNRGYPGSITRDAFVQRSPL